MRASKAFNLPLEIDQYRSIINDNEGLSVAFTYEGGKAQAICESVNKHDQLIEALKAAMNYIKECPCDPDIYPDQLEAWNKLQSLNVEELLGE